MGASFAPAVAQACAAAIVNETLRRLNSPDIYLSVWLDNFFCFSTNEESALRAQQVFLEVAEEANAHLKETSPVSHIVNLLGLRLNLQEKTITPGDSVRDGLERAQNAATATTAREWMSLAAVIFYPNYIFGGVPLALTPALFGALQAACAAAAREESWDATVKIDEAAFAELRLCASALLNGRKLDNDIDTPPPDTVLWVDASTKAIGALLQSQRGDSEFSWHMTCTHDEIYYAELMAAVLGQSATREPHILASDNAAAAAAMRKGHASTRRGNEILRKWIRTTTATHIAWVPTDRQRADKLTRPDEYISDCGRWIPQAWRLNWRLDQKWGDYG